MIIFQFSMRASFEDPFTEKTDIIDRVSTALAAVVVVVVVVAVVVVVWGDFTVMKIAS